MMFPEIRAGETPPFYELDEYTFQELCRDLLGKEPGVATCDIFGRRGQRQFGIDLRAPRMRGSGIEVGQCKCYQEFPPGKIREASDEFFANWGNRWAKERVRRFVLFVACDLSGRTQQDEIGNQENRFRSFGIAYEAWSAATIRNKLRSHPGIVKTYLANPEYWAQVICGETSSVLPSPDVRPSRVVSAVLVDELDQLASTVSIDTERHLELMRKAWREGRRDEVIGGLKELKGDAPRWRVLPPNVKAKILRLEASLELEATGNISRCRQLADEARSLAPSDNDARLRALIAYRADGPQAALSLLAGQQDIDSLNLTAALLLEMGRTEDCRALLESIVRGVAEPNAETYRIWSLLNLLTRDLGQARLEIQRAQQLQFGWESIEFTAAVIDYFSAMSPVGLPERLIPWPVPVEWTVIKVDDESLKRLRKAAGVFKQLAERPGRGKDERQTLESWHLACLSNDSDRQEEAAEYCRALLRADPTNYRAIPWTLARNFKLDLKPSEKALRKAIANGTADIPQIIALVSCYLAFNKAKKATSLLAKTKPTFGEHMADELWTLWYAQSLVADGAPGAALREIDRAKPKEEWRHVKTIALWALAKESGDWPELMRHLESSYDETRDPIFLLRACEMNAQARDWAYVADRAVRLVEELGTGESLRLAAIASYNVERYELCLQLLDGHLNLLPGQRLPLELRRIRILCQQALSLLPEAIRDAELLAREEPTTDNLRTLAKLYFNEGDLKGLAVVARRLSRQPDLTAEQALEICRWVRLEDWDLAVSIWRWANRQGIPDTAVGLAVTLGYQLGLDKEVSPLLPRMTQLGATEQGGIKIVTIQDLISFLRERGQHALQLDDNYRHGTLPIHVVAGSMNFPLARLYHLALAENERSPDPYRQFALLARHGSRTLVSGLADSLPKRLHLDLTAILLAEHLGILSQAEEAFGPLRIPPDAIPALLQMRDNLVSQQPSRLRAFREVVELSERGILVAEEYELPLGYENPNLVEELGEAWVASFESARKNAGYLVDFFPLERRDMSGPSTALPEDANRSLVSCRALADALRQKGPLSEGQHAGALKKLGTQGHGPGGETVPAQGKLLYCHGTIPEVLSDAKLLQIVCERFQVRMERRELDRVRAELREDEYREALAGWISRLIDRLSAGISNRAYELIPALVEKRETEEEGLPEYPDTRCLKTLLLFEPHEGDVIWVDDRYVNGFLHREDGVPIVGVNEVLKALVATSALQPGAYYEKLNRLRAANVRLIPIQPEEILYHLGQVRVEDGILVETRELQIIRRYSASCMLWYRTGEPSLPGSGAPKRDEAAFLLSLRRAATSALIGLWENEEEDEGARHAKADWILSNLYVDLLGLFNVTSLPRPPQDNGYLVAVSIAGLVSQAFGLRWDDPSRPAPRRRYLDWLFNRVLRVQFDLDARLLVTVGDVLKKSLTDARSEVLGKGPKAAVLRVLQRFYEDLPEPIRDELGKDASFMESIGLKPIVAVSVDGFSFEANEFYATAREAINGRKAKITPIDSSSEVTFEPLDTPGPCAFVLDDRVSGRRHHVADDAFCLLHDSASVREEALRRNRQWFDCRGEEYERLIAEIATMEDPQSRIKEARTWSGGSAASYYRNLNSQLRSRLRFDVSDLRPASAEGLLRHFRLSPGVGSGEAFSEALAAATDDLTADEGLPTAIERLMGFPVGLPRALVEAIGQLHREDRKALFEQLLETPASPLSRTHILRLLLRFAEDEEHHRRRAREIIYGSFDTDGTEQFRTFLAVLRWTNEEFSRWADARTWSPHLRLAMTWAHAHRLFTTFVSAGAPLPWMREEFERLRLSVPAETFHRDLDYWFDIAHPRRVEHVSFILSGLAYSIGDDRMHVVDETLREFLASQAFADFGGARFPVPALLVDPTRARNNLNSFLGGDRGETLRLLLSSNDAGMVSGSSVRMLAETAMEEIIKTPGETAAWLQLYVTIGDLPPDQGSADRLKTTLQKTDFRALFENPNDAAQLALLTACLQIGHLNDEDLRGRLKRDLVNIAKTLAERSAAPVNKRIHGAVDLTKPEGVLLESALDLSVPSSGESPHAATEFAELVTRILEAWPSVGTIYRPVVQRLSEKLPIEDVSHLWPLLVRLRAEA